MRLLLPAATVWSRFDYFSHPTNCCWQPNVRYVPTLHRLVHKRGKGPAGDHVGFLPRYLSLAFLPSSTSKGTRKCIMKHKSRQQRVLSLLTREHAHMHTPAGTSSRYRHRYIGKTHTQYTPLHTSSALVGSSIPRWQTVRLFLTIDLRSLLFKVWFHSGDIWDGSRRGFMVGARRHSIQWGFISLCHPGHSPLTQLSAPPLSRAPSPGFFLNFSSRARCIPGGPRAWVVALRTSCLRWLEEGKGRKMQRGPLTARSTMWALMMAAWMWCSPATDPYCCHSPAFYNLMIHPAARRRRFVDLSPRLDRQAPRMDWPSSNPEHEYYPHRTSLWHTHHVPKSLCHNNIYWPLSIHSRWEAYTHCENKYKYTPKQLFTLTDAVIIS